MLSVIVPAYNEEECLAEFVKQLLKQVKKAVSDDYEILIVDDGSKDRTSEVATEIAKHNPRIRLVSLSRNFGKEIATTAGLFLARGDALIMIDADGQHPPELIKQFVDLWKAGNQVVIGIRESNKKEGVVKKYGSKLFYKLFNATSETVLIPGATDYRLIDKVVQQHFIQFTERYRITRGLIDWMGFKRATISFHANARMGGQATYRVSRLITLALNSFVSHSMAPLYAIGYTGVLVTATSLVGGLFIFIEQALLNDPLGLNISGTAMIGLLILFLVGIVLTAQGLIAIYLSHIHIQTQNRPLFIVDELRSVNLHDK